MGIVICKLPKAGLGNQLFPLMRAYSFAHLNKLPIMVTNYNQVKIGPWLRRERSKRNYRKFYIFQKSFLPAFIDSWKLNKFKNVERVIEPELGEVNSENDIGTTYFFSAIPHYSTLFKELLIHRDLVIKIFWQIVTPAIKEKINRYPAPYIGVHIRMGDFRKLKPGEEFGKMGIVRTPENYFIEMISGIRDVHGSEMPVSIFTDGLKSEFAQLFSLPNVSLFNSNNDLVDLIQLSRSKILITSAGSTFSYWAGFLSDALIIMHPTYVNMVIRPESLNNKYYYGAFNLENDQLRRKIRMIQNDQ